MLNQQSQKRFFENTNKARLIKKECNSYKHEKEEIL